MDIKFFEARSIWQGYFFSVVIPSATPRELLKVAGFFREYDVFLKSSKKCAKLLSWAQCS